MQSKLSVAVLNLSDGIITTYGYLLAVIIRLGHIDRHQFMTGALGAGISMAIGQRLEDMTSKESAGWGNFTVALVASVIGSFIPPLAYFFLSGHIAAIITAALTLIATLVVAHVLGRIVGHTRAYLNVFGLFSIGIGLELLLSL